MKYEIIYSIALDLIEKHTKFNPVNNQDETLCVLMTKSSNIISKFSRHIIKSPNQVENICAETEALSLLEQSNETKIVALIVLNCKTKIPMLPCTKCRKQILSINGDNYNTLIMLPNGEFAKLYETYNIDENKLIPMVPQIQSQMTKTSTDNNNDWENGWDIDDTPPNQSNMLNNAININNDKTSWEDGWDENDNIQQPINLTINSFQSVAFQQPINNYSPQINSNLYTIPLNDSSRVFSGNRNSNNNSQIYPVNNASTIDSHSSSSIYNRRLQSLLSDDVVSTTKPKENSTNSAALNMNQSSNIDKVKTSKNLIKNKFSNNFSKNHNVDDTQEHRYTKKELITMAKDKKKQAKKNRKILDSTSN